MVLASATYVFSGGHFGPEEAEYFWLDAFFPQAVAERVVDGFEESFVAG